MATLTIDGKDYDVEKMSDEGKNILATLQFTETGLQKAQSRLAVLQTAKNAYITMLKNHLEVPTKN